MNKTQLIEILKNTVTERNRKKQEDNLYEMIKNELNNWESVK